MTKKEQNLLHEALETEFKYIPSKAFKKWEPEQVKIPVVPANDPFASVFTEGEHHTFVLCKNQEPSLFIHYNWLKRACKMAVRSYNKNHTASYATQVVKLYREYLVLRDVLFRANIGLVIDFSRQYAKAGYMDKIEFIPIASESLLKAINKYEVDRGWRFSTFAATLIIRDLKRTLGKKQIDRSRYTSYISDLDDRREVENVSQLEKLGDAEQLSCLRNIMKRNLAKLNKAEKYVIRARFFSKLGLTEVGERIESTIGRQITKERVRQIQMNAQQKILKAMQKIGHD